MLFLSDIIPTGYMAAEAAGALTIHSGMDVMEELKALTGGRGPDASIDAIGMEAHGSAYDQVKQTLKMETDRLFALRQAIRCPRKAFFSWRATPKPNARQQRTFSE